jgi:hypothetical protein
MREDKDISGVEDGKKSSAVHLDVTLKVNYDSHICSVLSDLEAGSMYLSFFDNQTSELEIHIIHGCP